MRTVYPSQYTPRRRKRNNLVQRIATASLLGVIALYELSQYSCNSTSPTQVGQPGYGQGQGSGQAPKIPGKGYGSSSGGTGSYGSSPLDDKEHLDRARKVNYDVQAQDGKDPSKDNNPQKNVSPTLDDILKKEDGRENYERETSYIVPRPTVGIDQNIRDALVGLDLSGSTAPYAQNGINIPAVAAIAISRFYIEEKGATVAGLRFNDGSDFTNYTDDLNFLAKFFAQQPGGGTELDVSLLTKMANDPNRPNKSKPLDLYIISDLQFDDIYNGINRLSKSSNIGRIYVLVIGGDQSGVTTMFGPNAFRAPLGSYNDLYTFYRTFTQDSSKPMNKVP